VSQRPGAAGQEQRQGPRRGQAQRPRAKRNPELEAEVPHHAGGFCPSCACCELGPSALPAGVGSGVASSSSSQSTSLCCLVCFCQKTHAASRRAPWAGHQLGMGMGAPASEWTHRSASLREYSRLSSSCDCIATHHASIAASSATRAPVQWRRFTLLRERLRGAPLRRHSHGTPVLTSCHHVAVAGCLCLTSCSMGARCGLPVEEAAYH
jgi:hypothetical protein